MTPVPYTGLAPANTLREMTSLVRTRRFRGAIVVAGLVLATAACEVPGVNDDVDVIPYKPPAVNDPNAALSNDLNPAPAVAPPPTATPPAEVLAALVAGVGTLGTGEYSATLAYFGGMDRGGDLMTVSGRFDHNVGRAFSSVNYPGHGLIEIITEGDYAYIRVPLDAKSRDLAGRWLVLPQSAVAEQLPNLAGLTDPAAFIGLLTGISGEMTLVGEEPVEGVPTARYRAVSSVNTEAVTSNLNERASRELQRAFDEAGVSDVPINMEVWVDGAGQARRLRVEMPIDSAAGAGATMVLDMTLRKHNQPVELPPNPADALDGTAPGVLGEGSI